MSSPCLASPAPISPALFLGGGSSVVSFILDFFLEALLVIFFGLADPLPPLPNSLGPSSSSPSWPAPSLSQTLFSPCTACTSSSSRFTPTRCRATLCGGPPPPPLAPLPSPSPPGVAATASSNPSSSCLAAAAAPPPPPPAVSTSSAATMTTMPPISRPGRGAVLCLLLLVVVVVKEEEEEEQEKRAGRARRVAYRAIATQSTRCPSWSPPGKMVVVRRLGYNNCYASLSSLSFLCIFWLGGLVRYPSHICASTAAAATATAGGSCPHGLPRPLDQELFVGVKRGGVGMSNRHVLSRLPHLSLVHSRTTDALLAKALGLRTRAFLSS